ncbi:efflux RND transporter periplasmic adaptor subunit [Frigidibacter oleivorans]|uniref:efflux RND transporter periplasmic adaptor subunit n=1 Tax=Frigidibacter oleivorans TaxID=2487129 RepID=UPI0013DF6000|nr:efflux RND transporter periplasmic adaptor subunit [Frigidibacter oleivorans]
MVKRIIIAIILLGVVVGGIVGFNLFRDKMIAQYFAGMTPPPVVVSVSEATPITWTPGIEAVGTARAAQGVDLSVEASGVVREVLFEPNQQIEQGQQLVQIDDRSEQADLAAAIAARDLSETELSRTRALEARGVSTADTLDTAEASAVEARAQVERINAALDQKRAVAPFSGTVGIPQIEAGEYVTPGTIYATLQDISRMRVDFALTEQDAAMVRIGTPVTVSSEVGDVTAQGRITGIEPQVDPASRLVDMRAEVDNPGAALTPGQFLRVRVQLPAEEGVIALPQTAVTSNLYGNSVWIVRDPTAEDEPMRVEQVFVRLGRRSDDLIEIAEGVEAGDRVVNAGQNRLSGNAAVTIDNSVAPVPAGETVTPAPGAGDAAVEDAAEEGAGQDAPAPGAPGTEVPAPDAESQAAEGGSGEGGTAGDGAAGGGAGQGASAPAASE